MSLTEAMHQTAISEEQSPGIGANLAMNHHSQPENRRPSSGGDVTADELTQIRDSLRGLRFGSLYIVVQDGVIVQIDRTEKRRLRGVHASAE